MEPRFSRSGLIVAWGAPSKLAHSGHQSCSCKSSNASISRAVKGNPDWHGFKREQKVESLLLNWQDGQDFFFHHTLWDQVIRATRLCWLLASPSLPAKSERVKGSDSFWAFFKSLSSKLKLRTRCRASKMSDFRLAFGMYTTQKVWRALTATRGVSKIRYLS